MQLSLVKQVAGRYLPVVNRSEQLADFFSITTWRSIPFHQNRSDILSTMLRGRHFQEALYPSIMKTSCDLRSSILMSRILHPAWIFY